MGFQVGWMRWCTAALVGACAACTSPVARQKPVPADAKGDGASSDGLGDAALSDADVAILPDVPDVPTPDAAVDVMPPLLIADLPECVSCTWTHLASMNKPRQYAGGAWLLDKFYVWGGYSSLYPGNNPNTLPPKSDGMEATGEVYDPKTDKWTMLPQAPLYPASAPVVAGGGRLYVYNNSLFDGPTPWTANPATVAAFDPATSTWSALPTADAPGKRGWPKLVWTGSGLLVWDGAYLYPGVMGPSGIYDPVTDKWTPLPAPPVLEIESWFGVWTGATFIVPQLITQGPAPVVGLTYTPAAKTWTTFNGEPPPLPTTPPGADVGPWIWEQCQPMPDGFIGIGHKKNLAHRLLRFHMGTGTYDEISVPAKTAGSGVAASIEPTSMHVIGDWLVVLTLQDEAGAALHLPTGAWYQLPHPHKGKTQGVYASGVRNGAIQVAGGYGVDVSAGAEFIWKDVWVLTGPWTNSAGKP